MKRGMIEWTLHEEGLTFQTMSKAHVPELPSHSMLLSIKKGKQMAPQLVVPLAFSHVFGI